MSVDPGRHEELVLPVLLAEARRTYGAAIRRALAVAGFGDMPRAGARVVGGIARSGGTPLREVAVVQSVSKQAASQLVDTLVTRGYVVRVPDEDDRRRLSLTLTDRGAAAAAEIAGAVASVDAAFEDAVGAAEIARVRRALAALATLGHADGND
ncbi:MAG TPA: MarR family transcriptional regulator [Gaiellaceae bacterium]